MSVLGLLAKGAKAKPLRSTLDEAVEALARPKGTGAEFLREIEKTKGVKPTEIKERGIDKVLASMPKVNKEEIVKAIQSKANPPIEEKILGSGEHRELYPTESKQLKEMIEEHNSGELDPDLYNYMVDLLNRSEKSTNHSLSQKVNDVNTRMLEAKANGQKRLFNELSDEMDVLYDRQQRLNGVLEDNTKYGEYALPNGQNYREILLKLPKGEGDEFTSGHFQEPNILAHMRVSDRAGPNGEKVLHLEELQSDWHQKGREHGYKPPYKKAERTEANPYGFETIHDTNLVPDAPFKKNWHEVALKKLINYATENGYDRIAITPGAEQAKRYDISKQIDTINYDDLGTLTAHDKNGRKVISQVVPPEKLPDFVGKEIGSKIAENHAKRIDAHKAYREAIRSGASDDVTNPLYEKYMSHPVGYSNLDLQVGGEGMKGFYDKMLPDYLNKLGSPHGAQVQMHGMPSNPQLAGEFNNMLDHVDLTPEMFKALPVEQQQKITLDWTQKTSPSLHTFDLTPSLKNEVTQKGLPLYQQIGIPLGGAEVVNLAQPEPEMKRGGSVSISSNPDTMFMELADRKLAGGGAIRKIAEKLGTKIIPMAEAEANKAKFLSTSQEKRRLYHATPKNFKEFQGEGFDPTISGNATWLTANKERQPSAHNTSSRTDVYREGTNVMPVHIQAERPLVLDDRNMEEWAKSAYADDSPEFPFLIAPKWLEKLKEDGYDSIFHPRSGEVIMLEPNKIKSAIGNQGTYDTTNPDITKKRGGAVQRKKPKYGLGGIVKALTPMEEALAKMRALKQSMKPEIELGKRYEEATKDMYTKDMPSFEEWKKTLPPPEIK